MSQERENVLLEWAKTFVVGAAVMMALVIGFFWLWNHSYANYLVKARLAKVVSMLDPVKTTLAASYQRTGKLPAATIPVTAANQGQAATPDWAALGFAQMPALSREMRSLSIDSGGVVVVQLINIRDGIDDSEVRVIPAPQPVDLSWSYACTSADSMLKDYFHC